MSDITRKLQVIADFEHESLLKVAFASSDRQEVNQHFGAARAFVIYGLSYDASHLLTVSEFADQIPDINEDKLAVKLDLLEGCIAVYCRACGASAVRQLLARGIQPVKVSEGAQISGLIKDLQHELQRGPSSWLAKAIAQQRVPGSGFDPMMLEGWDE